MYAKLSTLYAKTLSFRGKLHSITNSNSWAFMESNLQTSTRVCLQHRYGDSLLVHQGVGQGKILSTHSYKVYINDILLLLGFMYSAEADGHFLFYFFFAYRSTGPNWSETQSPTAWITPPPTHHDLMKIY